MTARDILKKPYARRLVPDESGGFVATIHEFPGLVAEGETAEEAYRNLEQAAESWLEAAIETGALIPEPAEESSFSGRIALRLPRSLHKRAAETAECDNTSLNQLLVTAVSYYLGVYQGSKFVFEHSADRSLRSAATSKALSTGVQLLVFSKGLSASGVNLGKCWTSDVGSNQSFHRLENWSETFTGAKGRDIQFGRSIGQDKWQTQLNTLFPIKN